MNHLLRRFTTFVVLAAVSAMAQGPPGGPPPAAKVTVCAVEQGTLTPTKEWKGNVFYKEVSNVATEVGGKVVQVLFEEGQHIEQGAVMVRLDYALLESELRAAQAAAQQADTQLQLERARLQRTESLVKEEVTTEQEFDDIRFTAEAAEHRVEIARAEVERLEREIEKKTIRAPFSGRVVDRMTEVGDWKDTGDTVAVFARDDIYDVIVNVYEDSVLFATTGTTVDVRVADRNLKGEIVTVIPRGDMATGTFPVKVRIESEPWLVEGMTAWVNLPNGDERSAAIVPRDAVLLEGSQYIVYRIEQGAPVRTVVDLIGRVGLSAGIQGAGIEPGVEVITKGHERLRPGQPIEIIRAS